MKAVWTICDRTWGQSHARTVCTLLGYSNRGARQSIFDSGSNSVHFNNVQCFGRYCSYQGMYSTGTCFYFYIAGVQCNFDTLPPTASPTTIEAHKFNSTSVFLSWRPPLAQYRNGIIQGYHVHVDFTQANRTNSDSKEYTTVVPYLLINNLEPGVMYTFRVLTWDTYYMIHACMQVSSLQCVRMRQ